uniref:Uncharacterized protein n=1 Tax=Anopheles minimus TaxID=112268 RepID=A0A182WPZ6_9DIPT
MTCVCDFMLSSFLGSHFYIHCFFCRWFMCYLFMRYGTGCIGCRVSRCSLCEVNGSRVRYGDVFLAFVCTVYDPQVFRFCTSAPVECCERWCAHRWCSIVYL